MQADSVMSKKVKYDSSFKTIRNRFLDVLERKSHLIDLKEFDVIITPICENNHYYLVCVDLRTGVLEVVDNMTSRKKNTTLTMPKKFTPSGTYWKVRTQIVSHLQAVGNDAYKKLLGGEMRKPRYSWDTNDNSVDCGAFAMRHMEMYRGSEEKLETGFSTDPKIKKYQLNNYRAKIATTLLLSSTNICRNKVIDKADLVMSKITEPADIKRMLDYEVMLEDIWDELHMTEQRLKKTQNKDVIR